MLGRKLLIGLAAFLLLSPGLLLAAPHPSVLRVTREGQGGGTAVVIEGNRLVTVSHVARMLGREISFETEAGERMTARTTDDLGSGNRPDNLVYYKMEGKATYQGLKIAKSLPQPGERVAALGYPLGEWGEIVGVYKGRNSQFLVCRLKTSPGFSGGALVNEQGELIGVSSAVDPAFEDTDSYHVSIVPTQVRQPQTSGPDYVLFGSEWCTPCAWMAAEIGANGFSVRKVDAERDSPERRAFELKFGMTLKDSGIPTLWLVGGTDLLQGFDRTEESKQRLRDFYRRTGWGPFGDRKEAGGASKATPPKTDLGEPEPAAVEKLPPGAIEIVVLVARQDKVPGLIADRGIRFSKGTLRRVIDEHFPDGKVHADLVFERDTPERFKAISSAADVVVDGAAHVFVLVGKADLGLKGIIAKKVEAMVEGKVPKGTPVDLIFERVHPADYRAINEALLTREGASYSRDGGASHELPEDVAEASPDRSVLKSLSSLADSVEELKVRQESLHEKADDQKKDSSAKGWILSVLLAVTGFGSAASGTHSWRSWARDRILRRLKSGDSSNNS